MCNPDPFVFCWTWAGPGRDAKRCSNHRSEPPFYWCNETGPFLLNYFLKREALELGIPQKRISKKALQYLEDYQWEGNIRELENSINYILSTVDNNIVCENEIPDHFKKELHTRDAINTFSLQEEPMFSANSLSPAAVESPFAGYSWEDLEKDYVLYLLNKNRWNITCAANDAKINRSTFDSRMKKLGINKR